MLGAGRSIGLALFLTFVLPALAVQELAPREIDPQKAALIRQVLDASITPGMQEQVMNASLRQAGVLLRTNPIYPPGYVEALQSKLQQRFAVLDLAEFLIPVYASEFSIEELEQIKAFQTSPVGRKLLALQPGMYQQLSKSMASWASTAGQDVAREILAEHPEYAQQIHDRQQQAGRPVPGGPDTYTGPAERIGNGVSAPKLVRKTEPHYSEEARKAKVEGVVFLSLVVDAEGMPRNIRVTRPLGLGLDEKPWRQFPIGGSSPA